MTLRWLTLRSDDLEAVAHKYEEVGFPADIRDLISEWFESQNWQHATSLGETEKQATALYLYHKLLEQINRQKRRLKTKYSKTRVHLLIRVIKDKYAQNVTQLVDDLASCEAFEIETTGITREAESSLSGEEYRHIHTQYRALNVETAEIFDKLAENILAQENNIKKMAYSQNSLQKFLEDKRRDIGLTNALAHSNPQQLQKQVESAEQARQLYQDLELQDETIMSVFDNLLPVHEFAHLNLWGVTVWWRSQQLKEVYTGVPQPDLHFLELNYLRAADCIARMQRAIANCLSLFGSRGPSSSPVQGVRMQRLTCLSSRYHEINLNLIRRSFIMEKLPHLESGSATQGTIRSSGTKFSCVVRTLLGPLYSSLNMPKVNLYLVSEDNIHDPAIYAEERPPPHLLAAVILDGEMTMTCQTSGEESKTIAEFRGLRLDDFNRATNHGSDVTDMRYVLLACCRTDLAHQPVNCQLLSYPVLVTMQSSQDCDAAATTFWYAIFGEPLSPCPGSRLSWPEEGQWSILSESLSLYVEKASGRGLSASDLKFLQEKFSADHTSGMIRWRSFNKDRLLADGRVLQHTAWKWFFAITNMIRVYIREEWKAGNIIGFLSKSDAQRLVQSRPSGSTVIRFSETKLRGRLASSICVCLTLCYHIRPEGSEVSFVDHSIIQHDKFLQDHSLGYYLHHVCLKVKGCSKPQGGISYVIVQDENGGRLMKSLQDAMPLRDSDEKDDNYKKEIMMAVLTAENPAVDCPPGELQCFSPPSVQSDSSLNESEQNEELTISDGYAWLQNLNALSSPPTPGSAASMLKMPSVVSHRSHLTPNSADQRPLHDDAMRDDKSRTSSVEIPEDLDVPEDFYDMITSVSNQGYNSESMNERQWPNVTQAPPMMMDVQEGDKALTVENLSQRLRSV